MRVAHVDACSATLLMQSPQPWHIRKGKAEGDRGKEDLMAEIQDPPTPPASAIPELPGQAEANGRSSNLSENADQVNYLL